MELAKIVLRCLLMIAGLGAVLGGTSALICPEVFTLGKPPAFGQLPPPALGLVWGWLEFMMPGLVVGLALASAAQVGDRPAIKAMFFRKAVWAHLALVGLIAIAAGLLGWIAVRNGHWHVLGPVAAAVPDDQHGALGAVWWASRGAQLANLASGIALVIWTWKKRAEFDAIVRGQQKS